MRIADADLSERVLIVAEIGNNHEGSYALAEELIGRAAEAGVDAVKFQTFRTEHYVSRRDDARFERLKSFELSHDEFAKLAAVARQEGIVFLSTPFDLESVRFLDALVPAFKIASGDNTFYPLIDTVARRGKPILLSTGLADTTRIQHAKAVIEAVWAEIGVAPGLALLHCVSSYPVPPSQANLAAIGQLRAEFDCSIGYSDHTLGIEACRVAASLGARIIEKHFTLDKHYSDFRDHQLSADPREMAELVQAVRQVETMLGSGEKRLQECELSSERAMRRSITAARDLACGAIVTWEDITWVRPGGG
ncbi:MAG: N-acetylneuraminate synthase family protein, partial [Planctomycetota bacterium]|nr:N-acetylneuraminate synthase family protein [Planctomycetota bacterium]